MTEPITWMKHKYSVHKPVGGYRSGHNDSARKTKKVGNKFPFVNPPQGKRTLVIEGYTGKRRWRWL